MSLTFTHLSHKFCYIIFKMYSIFIFNYRIEKNDNDLKRLEIAEKEAEKQDLINMAKELELMKKCETEEVIMRNIVFF